MNDLRIPVPIAVVAWAASGLAVLSYTYLAFKETANGAQSGGGSGVPIPPPPNLTKRQEQEIVSMLPELKPLKNPTPTKPLDRGRFKRSR